MLSPPSAQLICVSKQSDLQLNARFCKSVFGKNKVTCNWTCVSAGHCAHTESHVVGTETSSQIKLLQGCAEEIHNAPRVLRERSESDPKVLRECTENVQRMLRACSEECHETGILRQCPEHDPRLNGTAQRTPRDCSENARRMPRECSKGAPRMLRADSETPVRMLRDCSEEALRMLREGSENTPRIARECSEDDSRLACSDSVPRMLRECYERARRRFKHKK